MAAQASVTLNTVAYEPTGIQKGVLGWVNRADGVPGKFSPLTEVLSSPSKGGKVYNATFKLVVPVVAASDSECACAGDVLRYGTFIGTFLLPDTSTAAERTDLRLRAKDLISNSLVTDAVDNLITPNA